MNSMIPLSEPNVRSSSAVDRYVNDVKVCGSPKGLRLQLQEFDGLEADDAAHRFTKYAAGCSAFAAFSGLAPALLAVVKNCPKITSVTVRECTRRTANIYVLYHLRYLLFENKVFQLAGRS